MSYCGSAGAGPAGFCLFVTDTRMRKKQTNFFFHLREKRKPKLGVFVATDWSPSPIKSKQLLEFGGLLLLRERRTRKEREVHVKVVFL